MSDKIKEFIESKGFTKIIPVGDNYNVDCPFCGDTKKRLGFSKVNEGKWNCFNCGKKAKTFKSFNIEFDKLTKGSPKLGTIKIDDAKVDKVKIKKKIDPNLLTKAINGLNKEKRKSLKYLTKGRGLSIETIKKFQLGSIVKNGVERVVIPFFLNGKLVDYKARAIDPKVKSKWVRYGGVGNFLWNNEALDSDNKKRIYICEAELDAMALWNAGIKNVVSLTNGAKSFPEEFFEKISRFKKVYLIYDNDEDGQYGAEKASKRIGLDKCFNVLLPSHIKDINEFFWDFEKKKKRHSLKEFKELISNAKQFEIKGVLSIHSALQELNREIKLGVEDRIYGIPSPWSKLNDALGGGVKPGELIVVAARPKVGKTTIMLNWLSYLDSAVESTPTLFISCEMNYIRVAQSIIRINVNTFTKSEDIDTTQVYKAFNKFKGDMQIYYPKPNELEIEPMREKIRDIVKKHGIKKVVFDNLLFMARGKDTSERVGEITRGFKLLAEELEIGFVLITHPRKTNHNKSLTPDDLKDSSSIFQDADALVLIHRAILEGDVDEESLEDEEADLDFDGAMFDTLTEIKVISRYSKGGKVYLNYIEDRGLFKDFGDGFQKSMTKKKEELLKYKKRKEKKDANSRR